MADILIIDDDEDLRQLLDVYLSEAGHVIRHAKDGREGLDRVEQAVPDLILLDINMPVMDGTHVMKCLRAAPPTAQVPVIALSAVAGLDIRDDMHALGCNAYVVKPIEMDLLMKQVDSLLS